MGSPWVVMWKSTWYATFLPFSTASSWARHHFTCRWGFFLQDLLILQREESKRFVNCSLLLEMASRNYLWHVAVKHDLPIRADEKNERIERVRAPIYCIKMRIRWSHSHAKNPSMASPQAEGSIFPVTCPYQLVLLPRTPVSCFPALLRPSDVSEPRSPSYFKLFLTLFPLAWSLYLSSTWLFISYSSFHIFSTIISSGKPFLIFQISSDHCFMLWSTFIFDFRAFITVCNSI